MEAFQLNDYYPQFPPDFGNQQPAIREIVEISSDEDEDWTIGQPESSLRTKRSPTFVKRAIVIDSTSDDGFPPAPKTFNPVSGPVRTKRQKLEHQYNARDLAFGFDGIDQIDYADHNTTHSVFSDQVSPIAEVRVPSDEIRNDNNHASFVLQPLEAFKAAETSIVNQEQRTFDSGYSKVEVDIGGEKVTLEAPPYYYDPKFEIRMYCGPGYEKFPIALGIDPEQQDICDYWDRAQSSRYARQQRRESHRMEMSRYINDTIDGYDSDHVDDVHETATAEIQCLHKIREVLPDIQRQFALEKIRSHTQTIQREFEDNDVQVLPSPADVVSYILESSEYPKQEKNKRDQAPAPDGTGVTIEWHKGDIECKGYQRDAVCLLAGHFEYIPTHFIHKVVQEQKSLLQAYLHIYSLDASYDNLSSKERLYRRSQHPRLVLEKKYTCKANGLRSKTQWANLVNELQAAKQRTERESLQAAREKEAAAREEANLQVHKASGNTIECQCCFDDEIPINRSVTCEADDMHGFCFACILGLAENQIGSMKHEMTCMHQSGCKAKLSTVGICLAIPSKLFDKLAFYQQQSEIAAACIEGLEQCPFCDFKAICDPVEVSSVFQCQNPDCKRVSCRKCHEDSHLPKSCEESKSDRRLSARHQVEEARSDAMMRTCPRCRVKIVKDVGCNKMKCVKCGCIMCYVCKTDISNRKDGGYGHFNDAGAKCILYDKDFNRHEVEADEAEKEAIKKVQAENVDIDEKILQINTGAMKQKHTSVEKVEPRPVVDRHPFPVPPRLAMEFQDLNADYQRRNIREQEYRRSVERRMREMLRLQAQHHATMKANIPQHRAVPEFEGAPVYHNEYQALAGQVRPVHRQPVTPGPRQERTVNFEAPTFEHPFPRPKNPYAKIVTGVEEFNGVRVPPLNGANVGAAPAMFGAQMPTNAYTQPSTGQVPFAPNYQNPFQPQMPRQYYAAQGLYDLEGALIENIFAPLNNFDINYGTPFAPPNHEGRLGNAGGLNAWDPFEGLFEEPANAIYGGGQINMNQFGTQKVKGEDPTMEAGMFDMIF